MWRRFTQNRSRILGFLQYKMCGCSLTARWLLQADNFVNVLLHLPVEAKQMRFAPKVKFSPEKYTGLLPVALAGCLQSLGFPQVLLLPRQPCFAWSWEQFSSDKAQVFLAGEGGKKKICGGSEFEEYLQMDWLAGSHVECFSRSWVKTHEENKALLSRLSIYLLNRQRYAGCGSVASDYHKWKYAYSHLKYG